MNKKDKTNNKLQFLYVDTNKREDIEIVQHFYEQLKWNAKYKNLVKIEVMYNLKDKLSAE